MRNPQLSLIVDDSLIQRKIFASACKSQGYDVILGENGRQGVELALQRQPDLILMDLSMPVLDGPSAVRELRTYPGMAHVPILALTASTDSTELDRARQAGYTDALDKSADRAWLMHKIGQQLSC